MNKPKLKLLRPIFAYLFPMFLFALLLFTGMAMHSTLKHEKRLERQNHDQKRMQIIMNRIQTEFSLNLQVDKQFSQFLEQLQSFSDFPQVSFDNFAEVFLDKFPDDFGKHCRLWYFPEPSAAMENSINPLFCREKTGLMKRVFHSLVELRHPQTNENAVRANSRFISGVFGENSAPWHLATERRGRLTPIIFERKQHYLYWESFSESDCNAIGFIAIFPGKLIENKRYALKRLAELIHHEERDIIPIFLSREKLKRLYPPVTINEKLPAADISPIVKSFFSQNGNFKPRKLEEHNDLCFYYDSIAEESPYFAILCKKKSQDDNLKASRMPMIIVGAIFLWSAFFWLRLADGRFKLEFAFRLLFFSAAMLPVALLVFIGIKQINHLHNANIRSRIAKGFNRLEALNQKSEEMISASIGLIKEELKKQFLQKSFLAESPNENRRGYQYLKEMLSRKNISLNYLFLMKPGKLSQYFAETFSNRLLARHHLDYFAASCYEYDLRIVGEFSAAKRLLLSAGQKSIFHSYRTSEKQMMGLFRSSIESQGFFGESESEKIINSSFIVGNEGLPAAYITIGYNIDDAIAGIFADEFNDPSLSSNELFLALFRDSDKKKKISSPDSHRAMISARGNRLQTFLKQSFESKLQLEYFHENTVFIYDPLFKVRFLCAAAAIEINDLVNERDFNFLKLAIMLAILTGIIYLLAAWVSQTMIEPTADLATVFSEISIGNYAKSFVYAWKNELGMLAEATNVMSKGLRQREVLGKFVSPTFDKDVMAGANELMAQQIHGTIIFSDIRSFTTMAESQPPEAISLLLNHHLQEMGKEIQNFNGQIEQFIGDAIVAFFPGAGQESGQKALDAATAMMKKHLQIVGTRTSDGLPPYEIGIGLEYGLVMAGTLRSGSRFEFAVLGPARSKAEEFESASKKGKFTRIIVGNSLVSLLKKPSYKFCRHDEDCFELQSLEKES